MNAEPLMSLVLALDAGEDTTSMKENVRSTKTLAQSQMLDAKSGTGLTTPAHPALIDGF